MSINNVTRMLDSRKIKYRACKLPDEKLGAVEVAEILGVSPILIYKTIVAIPAKGGKSILALVPGDSELNLKALATAIGEKKIKVASHNQAEELTGLQTGGISPLALINKGFRVFIDETASTHEQIFISGGQRGLNLELAPSDLVKLTKAKFASIKK